MPLTRNRLGSGDRGDLEVRTTRNNARRSSGRVAATNRSSSSGRPPAKRTRRSETIEIEDDDVQEVSNEHPNGDNEDDQLYEMNDDGESSTQNRYRNEPNYNGFVNAPTGDRTATEIESIASEIAMFVLQMNSKKKEILWSDIQTILKSKERQSHFRNNRLWLTDVQRRLRSTLGLDLQNVKKNERWIVVNTSDDDYFLQDENYNTCANENANSHVNSSSTSVSTAHITDHTERGLLTAILLCLAMSSQQIASESTLVEWLFLCLPQSSHPLLGTSEQILNRWCELSYLTRSSRESREKSTIGENEVIYEIGHRGRTEFDTMNSYKNLVANIMKRPVDESIIKRLEAINAQNSLELEVSSSGNASGRTQNQSQDGIVPPSAVDQRLLACDQVIARYMLRNPCVESTQITSEWKKALKCTRVHPSNTSIDALRERLNRALAWLNYSIAVFPHAETGTTLWVSRSENSAECLAKSSFLSTEKLRFLLMILDKLSTSIAGVVSISNVSDDLTSAEITSNQLPHAQSRTQFKQFARQTIEKLVEHRWLRHPLDKNHEPLSDYLCLSERILVELRDILSDQPYNLPNCALCRTMAWPALSCGSNIPHSDCTAHYHRRCVQTRYSTTKQFTCLECNKTWRNVDLSYPTASSLASLTETSTQNRLTSSASAAGSTNTSTSSSRLSLSQPSPASSFLSELGSNDSNHISSTQINASASSSSSLSFLCVRSNLKFPQYGTVHNCRGT